MKYFFMIAFFTPFTLAFNASEVAKKPENPRESTKLLCEDLGNGSVECNGRIYQLRRDINDSMEPKEPVNPFIKPKRSPPKPPPNRGLGI